MVTFAQAQERAEEWINGDVPAYQHREVRVREFGLGFVVWSEDRAGGPVSGGGRQRLVIARDSGEVTLWPGLPVGEVIRRYEEEYGAGSAPVVEASVPSPRIDSEQTSFMLSPPEWLQEAADRAGIPAVGADSSVGGASGVSSASGVSGGSPVSGGVDAAAGSGAAAAPAAPVSSGPAGAVSDVVPLRRGGGVPYEPTANDGVPAGTTPWAGTDVNSGADEPSVPLPATVFAPPLSGSDLEERAGAPSGVAPEAKTTLMSGGSQLPRTAIAPALGQGAGDIADAPTSKAQVSRPGVSRAAAGAPADVPSAPPAPPALPGASGAPGGGLDHAATMLAGPAVVGPPAPPGPPPAPGVPAGPGVPPGPPGVPGAGGGPGGGLDHAATMLAGPAVVGPPAPPGPPPAPGVPAGPGVPPGPPGV
ncbi:hypothetical protein ABZ934_16865, partial [Streptomyces sp. NPDC046557]